MDAKRVLDRAGVGLGVALIAVGVLLMVGLSLGVQLGHYLWPLFILGPGLALLLLGLLADVGKGGVALAIIGSIMGALGTLLLYQTITGHWESWAYAWSLVAPTSVGFGMASFGAIKRQDELVRAGRTVMTVGLALFAVGAVLFELIIGISGFGLGGFGWPILLIGAGLFMLVRGIVHARKQA